MNRNLIIIQDLGQIIRDLAKERDSYKAKAETAISLVDGAKTIVELWEAKTPAQIVWKREWIEQARKIMEGKGIC